MRTGLFAFTAVLLATTHGTAADPPLPVVTFQTQPLGQVTDGPEADEIRVRIFTPIGFTRRVFAQEPGEGMDHQFFGMQQRPTLLDHRGHSRQFDGHLRRRWPSRADNPRLPFLVLDLELLDVAG